MITLSINGREHHLDVPAQMPLLWVIRDVVGLTGTKFGCGGGFCGCCTVHLDGAAIRSCVLPVSVAVGKKIITIEALGGDELHPVQRAWLELQVPQCGYCQSGQIMAAAGLLAQNPHPTEAAIVEGMSNICRCGTYGRIKNAVAHVAAASKKS